MIRNGSDTLLLLSTAQSEVGGDGIALDPPSEGLTASSGVSLEDSTDGEAAGEVAGVTAEVVGPLAAENTQYQVMLGSLSVIQCSSSTTNIAYLPLHWLMGGVFTLQAPGSWRA